MTIYELRRRQTLNIDLECAWHFFWTPLNLQEITPGFLHFRITSPIPNEIHDGLIITYRISAIAGVPMTWVTEIKHVVCPNEHAHGGYCQFVDEQRLGPFLFWHHLHRFTPGNEGMVMEDIVHYAMPWGWLGRLLHAVFIRKRLEHIFDYRRDHLDKRFNGRGSP